MAQSDVKSEVILPAESGLPQPAPLMSLRLAGEPAQDTTTLESPGNKSPRVSTDKNPGVAPPAEKKKTLRRRIQALFQAPDLIEDEDGDNDEADEAKPGDEPEENESPLGEDKSPPPAGPHKVYREASSVLRDGLLLSLESYDNGDSEAAFALFVASADRAKTMLREAAEDTETAGVVPTLESLVGNVIEEAFSTATAHASDPDKAGLFIEDETAEERASLLADIEAESAVRAVVSKFGKAK